MNITDKINPKHTALIVIDMQNDFCSKNGLMAKLGKNVSGMDELVSRIHSLIDVCKNKHIPVFFTQQIYDRSKLTPLQREQYDLDGKMITCDVNTEGYKFYGFRPSSNQIYPKYTYNIFSNPKLQKDLDKSGIKTLIIAGVSTQICVETAVRNGFDIGYKIVIPEDLVATTSSDATIQQRTLGIVRKTYGVVSSLDEVTRVINKS